VNKNPTAAPKRLWTRPVLRHAQEYLTVDGSEQQLKQSLNGRLALYDVLPDAERRQHARIYGHPVPEDALKEIADESQ
jgi:hypothetical protein